MRRTFALSLASGCLAGVALAAFLNRDADVPWEMYGGAIGETHFSEAAQITPRNIAGLKPAWSVELGVPRANSEPIEANGVIYVAAGLSIVQAFDARSGKPLWRYDPEVGRVAGIKLRQAWGIRGLAYSKGRLFVGTQDGRLISLDAKSGKPIWSVQTTEGDDGRAITGAPRVFGDKVIIGHGGADFAAVRGYVTCYDAETGRYLWRFYTVPGNPAKGFEDETQAMAAKTWSGEWWNYGGGGTVWNAIAYDSELNRVYLGTGNGGPWNWKIRNPKGGDALFLASIVALDANTGRYIWHYQENPNEAWDYNATMDIELATLTIDGRRLKVLMQAPKNGFFYVIDRETGKLISAEKLGKVTWADRIDLKTGRPIERPGIRYENGPSEIWPSNVGVHNWPPMSYSPKTKLVYLPVIESGMRIGDTGVDIKGWKDSRGIWNTGMAGVYVNGYTPTVSTSLLAWDPVRQRAAWRVSTPPPWNGGTLATSGGLVFQGQIDGAFNAYDANTGKRVWSYFMGNAALGTPISFSLAGKQYISLIISAPVGALVQMPGAADYNWDNRTRPVRLVTFALGGTARLPDRSRPKPPAPLNAPGFHVDAKKAAAGIPIYSDCVACHGADAISTGAAPDLRMSPIVLSKEAFKTVVHDGAMVSTGMPAFPELDDRDLFALQNYIRAMAARRDLKPDAFGSSKSVTP